MIIPRAIQPAPESMQVSGLYGPGNWAAWVITMFASWIPLLQGDYTHNLHFIGYAMYTNWAAIDLIRHGLRPGSPNQRDLSDLDWAWLGNFVASVAVIQIGVYQVVAQLLFGYLRLQFGGIAQANRSLEARRCLILSTGAVLPLSMGSYAILLSSASDSSRIALLTCCVSGLWLVGYNACQVLKPRRFMWEFTLRELPLLYLYAATMLVCSLSFLLMSSLSYFLSRKMYLSASVRQHRQILYLASLPEQCYFIPCAPQGIGEWDQAFSLVVALCLFLYEFGYEIFRIGREAVQGMWTIWQRAVR